MSLTKQKVTVSAGRPIKEPRGDRAFNIINFALLALFTLSVVYPLIYVFSSSVSSGAAISSGAVKLWPVGFNVDAYGTILSSPNLVRGFLNSVLYTVAGATIGTILTVLAGYPLSRADLPFRRGLTLFSWFRPCCPPASSRRTSSCARWGCWTRSGRSCCPRR